MQSFKKNWTLFMSVFDRLGNGSLKSIELRLQTYLTNSQLFAKSNVEINVMLKLKQITTKKPQNWLWHFFITVKRKCSKLKQFWCKTLFIQPT